MSDDTRHTLHAFDDDLDSLRASVSKMGELVEASISAAMKAIESGNADGATQIITNDLVIDQLQLGIERDIVRLLAIRAPMADDLRDVVAALKIASVLERIGDYAKNIARRVSVIGDLGAIDSRGIVASMGRAALSLVVDANSAFSKRDAEAARDIGERDQQIDQLFNELSLALVAQMMKNPKTIAACTHLLSVAKGLERIGDHATNLAEMVYFAAVGTEMPDRIRWPASERVG
ncbi:phosphate signaling complex protein PhoU [Sphingomonas sp.]|uniref:phosphate signaling complex protein PhoU n=1 Tax=Sphingomonas sp. TaxID=28214 RepID=UPI0025F05E76|nr:phosphate signaling complex protein PhoU [Sphingomonas sp.]